jgi:hypothetical protein
MRVLARAALSNEAGGTHVRKLIATMATTEQVIMLLAGRTTGFALAASHLMGTAVARYLGRLPALTSLNIEELAERVSAVVQHYLKTRDSA